MSYASILAVGTTDKNRTGTIERFPYQQEYNTHMLHKKRSVLQKCMEREPPRKKNRWNVSSQGKKWSKNKEMAGSEWDNGIFKDNYHIQISN